MAVLGYLFASNFCLKSYSLWFYNYKRAKLSLLIVETSEVWDPENGIWGAENRNNQGQWSL